MRRVFRWLVFLCEEPHTSDRIVYVHLTQGVYKNIACVRHRSRLSYCNLPFKASQTGLLLTKADDESKPYR